MYTEMREFVKSKSFQGILVGIALAVMVMLIFQAGVMVGYRKAAFAYHFGDNYYRTFGSGGGERGMFFSASIPSGRTFPAAHGAAGKVVSISLPTFVVAGPDNVEKVVLINEDTLIKSQDSDAKPEDLKVDDFTVVLGTPNEESQIEAKLIRIMPFPPEEGMKIRISQ